MATGNLFEWLKLPSLKWPIAGNNCSIPSYAAESKQGFESYAHTEIASIFIKSEHIAPNAFSMYKG